MRAELVRQFDVLGGIVAEAIHAVGHGLLEESLHAVADFLVLGIEIPQAEQVAVGHLPTIAVIDCGAVISASAFGFCVEQACVLPAWFNGVPVGGEVVDDGVHDDADAVLVGLGGHGLEVVFGTDDRIADRGAGRLVDVVPVLGEFLALHGSLDDADRRGLDRRVTRVRDFGHVFLHRVERPHPRMQDRTVVHLLGQAVLGACGFELRVAERAVVARRGGGLCAGCADGKASDECGGGRDAGGRLGDESAHRRATVDSGAQTGVFRQRGHVRCLLFSEGIFGCAPHGAALRCCPLDAGNAPSDQAHSSGQSDGASVRNHCATVCGNALCSDLESYVKCSRKRFCELG